MDLASPQAPVTPPAAAQHFLARADVLIDWSRFGQGGAADVPRLSDPVPVYALKIALLKQWYGLSDQEASFHILDRTSLRSFVGFAGDDGDGDMRILDELDSCRWGHHPLMAEALEAVELQLQSLGYAVRAGRPQEPSLAPCTASGSDVPESKATTLFRPGELGRMVEAVTAKAHADGVMPAAASSSLDAAPPPDLLSASAQRAQEGQGPGDEVRAVLEWPWGQRTELTEHLNIGRDFQFSLLARELTPYTHVSRKHAELLVYGDGVWVRDLGSRNGTYVNDEEVPKGQAYLIDSDSIIRFGPLLAVSLKLSV